jgi:Flp pilus assembly protein TadG
MTRDDHVRDGGFVGAVEVVYFGIFVLLAVVFLGYLGRLATAGIQVTNAAQDAARAASLSDTPGQGEAAANAAVQRSGLPARCLGGADVAFSFIGSELGSWQGGVVTVTVTCVVSNQSLTGVWSPGTKTVSVSDRQVVERFRE